MLRYSWLLTLSIILLCLGCGSSGGPEPQGAVFISASVDGDGDFIEAEMIKDISTTTALVTVTIGSNFDSVVTEVGTVRMETYEIVYTREDGGSPGLPNQSGRIDQTISFNSNANLPFSAQFEAVVMSTQSKAFSDFAQAFNQDLRAVTFDCLITVRGRALNGDAKSASAGFKVQAAVFLPFDDLFPTIGSVSQSENLVAGQPYNATWTAFNRVDGGLLRLPWGQLVNLDAGFFPFGSITADTSFLINEIPAGETRTFPSGLLTVFNPFGSDEMALGNEVMVSVNPSIPPIPASIEQFFSNRTTVTEGDSVLLTWSTTNVDELMILPETYSGVTVDFGGKDLSFDTVTIFPDQTVTPILRARNARSTAELLLQSGPGAGGVGTITVEPLINNLEPPEIVFFQPSDATVASGQQVSLFWGINGSVASVQLYPINGELIDVTGRSSFRTPPLMCNAININTFGLVVVGQDGTTTTLSTSVTCDPNANQQILIQNVIQQPGFRIDNDSQGSFSFNINDPERRDSSWRVRRIAGDRVSFAPADGKIPGGLGGASVAFNDEEPNGNGFFTFEISAWDDNIFGLSSGSTRAVELVTFQTDAGPLTGDIPVIEDMRFIPAGDGTVVAPGAEGVLEFRFSDLDSLNLRWTVSIIAGDFGGTFSRATGTVSTGQGEFSVRYVDDSDTPEAPVVFLLRVSEIQTGNPKSVIFVLEVDKSSADGTGGGGTTPGGGTPTGATIAQAFAGLFDNLAGSVTAVDVIADNTLFYNNDALNPQFFKNMDLSGPVDGASLVFDFTHATNPEMITGVTYTRTFAPNGTAANTGSLVFVGFFDQAGLAGVQSGTAVASGVGRWNMPFDINRFRDGGGPLNLPSIGFFDYQVDVVVSDQGGAMATPAATNVRVVVP